MPLKMPFRRFETWLEGVSGAKAVFFGFRWGASRNTPAAATATTMMISAMFFMFQPLPLRVQASFDSLASDVHHHETARGAEFGRLHDFLKFRVLAERIIQIGSVGFE